MSKLQRIVRIILLLFMLTQFAKGFYIKQKRAAAKQSFMENAAVQREHWSMFKHKPKTEEKVKIAANFKKQTALHRIVNLINKQKPTTTAKKWQKKQKPQEVNDYFNYLLTLAKQNEQELKVLKRPRRRISVQMVSDMSTDKIDELLKMFKEENEANTISPNDNNAETDYNDDEDKDYDYDNLYEDEQDMSLPRSAQHNTEFGSIQDLILQATRNQWQREKEETKLHNRRTQHFI